MTSAAFLPRNVYDTFVLGTPAARTNRPDGVRFAPLRRRGSPASRYAVGFLVFRSGSSAALLRSLVWAEG
jgi:hypothetical protein